MKLWSDNRSDELQRKRWTLFVAAASPRLDRDKLENLPTDLILPTMTLVYLRVSHLFYRVLNSYLSASISHFVCFSDCLNVFLPNGTVCIKT